jgi:hypothetical protein
MDSDAMRRRQKSDKPTLPPLRKFDFRLVRDRLDGLLINVSRSLERRWKEAAGRGDLVAAHEYTLVTLVTHAAKNSYNAIRYLITDTPPKDHQRKPAYVLVIPPINRQLIDMLFNLVYMLDDFPKRSFEYERASFREFSESVQRFRALFKRDPEWKSYFNTADALAKQGIAELKITPAERKNPGKINYWPHPGQIKEKRTPSRPFLRWLHEWIYGDTSAQAHVSPFGFSTMAAFFLRAISDPEEDLTARREYQIYKFVNFSRTTLAVLAIATDLNSHFALGFNADLAYLWAIMCEYVPEARDMYKQRYSSKI